jgi:drug/metabolite transporter (DMT)-like permease
MVAVPASAAAPRLTISLPSAADLGVLGVAVLATSMSGPLVASTVAPALAIAFWRNAMGFGAVFSYGMLRRRRELASIGRRDGGLAAGAGVFLALHFGTWIPSLTMTAVASSAALVSTQPVWAALLARLRGQRVAPAVWAGIACAVLGAALVSGVDVGVSSRALVGDLLALCAGAMGAAYVTVGAVVRERLSTTAYTTVCYGVCAAGLLVAAVVAGDQLAGYSGGAWAKLVALTLSAQLLGHSLFNVVLRRMSATAVSLVMLLEVPTAALIAGLWLHQQPSWLAVPGIALLLAGAAVVVRSSRSAAESGIGPDSELAR